MISSAEGEKRFFYWKLPAIKPPVDDNVLSVQVTVVFAAQKVNHFGDVGRFGQSFERHFGSEKSSFFGIVAAAEHGGVNIAGRNRVAQDAELSEFKRQRLDQSDQPCLEQA